MRSITSLFVLIAAIAMLVPTMSASAGGRDLDTQFMDTVQRAVQTLKDAHHDLDMIEDATFEIVEKVTGLEQELERGGDPVEIIAVAKQVRVQLGRVVADLEDVRSTVEQTREMLVEVREKSFGTSSGRLKRSISDAFTLLQTTESRVDKSSDKLQSTKTAIQQLIDKAGAFIDG